MVSTVGKINSINVENNQKKMTEKNKILIGEKKIALLLEKIYFSRFFVPFHAVHTLWKVFRND